MYFNLSQFIVTFFAIAATAFVVYVMFKRYNKPSYAVEAHHAIRHAGEIFSQTLTYSILNEDGSKEVKAQMDQLAVDLGKLERGTRMLLAMKKHPRFEMHSSDLINAAASYVASPLIDLDKKLSCLAKIEDARKTIGDEDLVSLNPKLAVITMTIVEDCAAHGIAVKVSKETINQSYAATRA